MKSKTTTKPIYGKEIEGAASALTGAYNTAAPQIQDATNQTLSLMPRFVERARDGDAAVNAARGYVTDTLGGDATNPHLDQWIDSAQTDAQNRLGAKYARMGLGPAGSTYQSRVGSEVAKIGLGARVDDWNAAQQRRAQAAGLAPGIAAGEAATVAPVLAIGEAAQDPVRAAAGYGSGLGGLLSPYTVTKQKGSLGGALMGLGGSVLSSWASGGFK